MELRKPLLSFEYKFIKADLDLAYKHHRASLVTSIEGLEHEFCECCNLPIVRTRQDAPLFPLDCKLKELKTLGVAFPLYFYLVRDMAYFFLFSFIFVGLPCLASFLMNDPSGPWYIQISAGAFQDSEAPIWQTFVHCITALLFFIYNLYFKNKTAKKLKKFQNSEITPRHFTVMITDLEENYDTNALKQLFGDMQMPVYSICPVYDIRSYVKDVETLNKLYEDLYFIQYHLELNSKYPKKGLICKSKKYTESYPKLYDLENQIMEKASFLDQFENNNSAFKREDIAFVTFQSRTDAENFMNSDIEKKFPFKVQEAPEPSDVLWEHLCYSKSYKLKNRFVLYLIISVVLVLSLMAINALNKIQTMKYDEIKYNESLLEFTIRKTASYSISITIVVINRIIAILIVYFSKKEKYGSMTNHHNAIFIKSYIAMCINSILTLLITEYIVENSLFAEGGIVKDVFNLLIIDATVSPLTFIISPIYCFKLLKRFFARRKADPNNKLPITQNQANKLWENPEVDLAQWYANTLKTVTIGIVFAPIFPLSLGITSITLIIQYWSSKILLLRRYARSKRYGDVLSKNILNVLGFTVFTYIFANIYFQYRTKTGYYYPELICLGIIGFYGFASIVMKRNENVFNIDNRPDQYEEYLPSFYNDYLRSNPITSKLGWKQWLDCIEKPEEYRIAFKEVIDRSLQKNVLTNIRGLKPNPKMSIAIN